MPYRKKTRTTYRRKNRKGKNRRYRRKYRRAGNNLQKQLLISDRTFVKLKFTETNLARTKLTIPNGQNYQILTYRSNDIPTHTGSSEPVPGFNEWASFYARYRVHAVKVKVTLCSESGLIGTASRPLLAMIHLQSDASPGTFTTWKDIMNFQGNRYTTFKPMCISAGDSQTYPTYLKRFYRLKYACGNPLQYKADDLYEATTGNPGGGLPSPPNRIFNYYIGVLTMDGSAVDHDQTVSLMVSTTFYVQFKDRFDLTA